MKKSFAETKKMSVSELPSEVYNTFKEWKTTFDESTAKKKAITSAKLQAHFDACEAAGLDREAVAIILWNVKF